MSKKGERFAKQTMLVTRGVALAETQRGLKHQEQVWSNTHRSSGNCGVYHFNLPRYPEDAPAGSRVLRYSRHVVELVLPGYGSKPSVYLGMFTISV